MPASASDESTRERVATAADAQRRPLARVRLLRAAQGAALLAAVIALLALAGWAWDLAWAKSVVPGATAMKPNTAVCLLLLAAGWFLPRWAAWAAGSVVLGVAVLVSFEYVAGANLGIDELLFADPAGSPHPGRVAAMAGVSLLLLSGAALVRNMDAALQWVEGAAGGVLILAALALLGYLYEVRSLYAIWPLSAMALPTAVALLLLALATLFSAPGGLVEWVVGGRDAGARMLRRVVPVTLLLIPLVGYLRVLGERAAWYPSPFGVALIVVASLALIIAVALCTARALALIDARRQQARAQLEIVNQDVESRVRERAEQVDHERVLRVRLEERQRLAADLHDIVIQRLYVAELNLQTIGGHGPERAHVATVIERIDDAIEGLREAIAELKTPNDQTDIAAALRSITDTVPTRMQVHLSVRGAREHLPARAARQLLAVAQEAVSNAVRHAAANQLGVDLELDADTLTLTVTDDGVGIGAAARPTSGMLNIRERAEQLGGHCRWQPNPPHGTAMVWQVPLLPPAQLAVVASRQASPIQPSGPTPQPTGSSVEVIVDE